MPTTIRQSGLLWPTILTAGALAVLITLGTWQLQRRDWKNELARAIELGQRASPMPWQRVISAMEPGRDAEYTRVSVNGTFRHQDERYLFAVENSEAGWHVYTPLETPDGIIAFINRGFVPDRLRNSTTRSEGLVQGQMSVTGLVRKPAQQGAFTPANEPEKNTWYWRDLDAMAKSLGAEGKTPRVVPFFVDAEASPVNPGGWPRGGVTRLQLPNRHLEYALTWYGLAATLIGVYLAFAVTRLRAAKA